MKSISSVLGLVGLAACTPGDFQPNIIFWFPDETRAESLGGAYGHPLTKTPNYNRLAASGTAFTNCHVLHTQCAPSRHAMTTGRYLHTLGHRTQTHAVQDWEPNMFRYLKEAGYNIYWFGKNDMLSQAAFEDSITYWDKDTNNNQSASEAVDFLDGRYAANETGGQEWSAAQFQQRRRQRKRDSARAISVSELLRQGPKEPFFLFNPTIGAHPPYRASSKGPGFPFGTAGYYSMWDNSTGSYSAKDIKEKAPLRPFGLKNKPRYYEQIPATRNLTSLSDDFFYRLNSVYLDMVTEEDAAFGTVLDALEANVTLNKRTAVFVSSDHGDFSGDAHLVEKWPGSMDDMLTRVPLLARLPPALYPDAPKGHVVSSNVQLFDVMPTFLSLALTRANSTIFAKDLLGIIAGTEEANPERTVYSEGGYLYPTEIEPLHGGGGTSTANPKSQYYPRAIEELWHCNLTQSNWSHFSSADWCHGSPRAVMARNAHHKIVYRPNGVSELYNITQDPREMSNLWDSHSASEQDAKQGMLLSLLQWFVLTSDVTPLKEDPRGPPPPPPKPPSVAKF